MLTGTVMNLVALEDVHGDPTLERSEFNRSFYKTRRGID
jgi:hypothetical protein